MENLDFIAQRIEKLEKEIKFHDKLYFENARPIISDYEYDCLVEQLNELYFKYPNLKKEKSQVDIIGEKSTNGFNKVEHKIPMLSLGKTYSFEEINKFFDSVEKLTGKNVSYVCELKLDGISINVKYKNGILDQISTRGNGTIGDDITFNKNILTNLPSKINNIYSIDEVDVRGEALMTFEDFDILNKNLKKIEKDQLANPRNATSGALKTLKFDKNDPQRHLNVFLYNLLSDKNENNNIKTQICILETLKKMDLPVCEYYRYCKDKSAIFDFINYWDGNKNKLQFPIDGIVIKVNELEYYEKLGVTNKNPHWAIAYKYKPEAISTKLINVEFQVGKSGIITPVANFEPIKLAGTIVQRATLHNENEMKRLDIKYGDRVLVKKSGEIIPKIIGVDIVGRDVLAKDIEFIQECPSCKTKLQKINDLYYCLNNSCPARQIELLSHFVSKEALNIKTIGPKTISLLISRKLINDPADFFKLRFKDIVRLSGFSSASAQKFFEELEVAKKNPFNKILFGLGIPHVGEVIAKNIAKKFKNIENIKNATIEDLISVDLVGDEVAKSVIAFFKNENNLKMIDELISCGFILEDKSISEKIENQKLKNLKFVITGTFENISRDELKKLIEINGGTLSETVSKNINFLIVGDNPGIAKVKKAKSENIKMIKYEDFMKMFSL